jgi:hypothetical protein
VSRVDPEHFVSTYPEIFHMATAGAWPSIRRLGLLSTAALVEEWEVPANDRERLIRRHRPDSIPLRHPTHGVAMVRDQRPMEDDRLIPLLRGIGADEWRDLLNRLAFFWATEKRLQWMLRSPSYRDDEHDVLVVRTSELVHRYRDEIRLCGQNSGSAYKPTPKRPEIFQPIGEFSGAWVAEVTVPWAVPDVADFTNRVEAWKNGERLRQIWP